MTHSGVSPSFAESLESMLELYAKGDCVAAWEIGRQYGPLAEWPGADGQLLAGRLAMHLGAPRLGLLLHLRTFRAHPDDPDAQYYHIFRLRQRRGALAAWDERKRIGMPRDVRPESIPDYHGQCAQLLGSLRDFDAAEKHIASARVPGGRLYWYTERAELYELEDRYDDALRTTQQGLADDPRYPPTIGMAAHCLQLLGRDDEALQLLRRSAEQTQSSHIVAYLIRLLMKRRMLDDVPEAIARYEALTPLREKEAQHWLKAIRAELATYRGDYAEAMEHIAELDHPFYGRIASNLREFLEDPARPAPRRVELDVPFVRQHHLTCAPATLTAISRFWDRPAEHLSVAEEICYDGTPDYSERSWAHANGWATREFRLEWGIATALIDRGVPFTLTTTAVTSGHLQAVIGYDAPTGVLLSRDPYIHETGEINARDLIIQQASSGPRGMAMVPQERAELLEGLTFPDAELYDLYHQMQLSLQRHDREDAVRWHRRMLDADAVHRLTLLARRSLAAYDDNVHEGLATVEALLALFPDEQRLQLDRLSAMRQLATREDRLALYETITQRPGTDSSLWIEYAQELTADDRRIADGLWLARRALRRRPDDPHAIFLLAELTWRVGRQEEATELYRFAACLSPARDDFAGTYFNATRLLKRTEEGFAFLRARAERAGGQASGPTIALFRAYELCERMDEAFEALEAGLRRRPDDGDLKLFAANRHAYYGRGETARELLEAARSSVRRAAWLAESARAARAGGDRARALADWREILRLAPLDMSAHSMTAVLLSETASREDAIAHLRSACKAFPHHAGLHRLLYQWSAHEPAATREIVLRKLLSIDPADGWAIRELALNLDQQSRSTEALAAAEEAVALDDSNFASHGIKAHVLASAGRASEAAECYRAAITRSADAGAAIGGLLDVCGPTLADRIEALRFIEQRLETQPVFGDGVLAYRSAARGVLTPEELLLSLRRIHEARPDVRVAWTVLARHLSDMGRTDEALDIATRAAERFSRVAHQWYEVALVHRARLEIDEEIAALERCRELDSESTDPVLALAGALERRGDIPGSQRVLEAAIARAPLSAELQIQLAQNLHRQGKTELAIDRVHHALRLDPSSDWGWSTLTTLFESHGEGEKTLAFARTFAEERPREVQAWTRLAQLQLRSNHAEDALASLDRAIEANPHNESAHELRAVAFTTMRRFRDALEACNPPILRDRQPYVLQGRAAWVEAQRGDTSNAIALMKAVVERVPDYHWGWGHLVEWYSAKGETALAAAAARRWAWLDSSNMVPLGWLGDLEFQLGNRDSAKEVFLRAMRLDPDYLFAGLRYFEMQKEEGDYAGAERTIEILRPHAGPHQLLAAEVDLEMAQAEWQAALQLITDACRDPAADRAALLRAVDIAAPTRLALELERGLADVMKEATFNPATPELWARVRTGRRKLGTIGRYQWLASQGAAGRAAIDTMLGAIGERSRRDSPTLLHPRGWYLDLHLALIRRICSECWADDTLWGNMGFALMTRGRSGAAIRWLSDWRERREVQPWMLHNLALALLIRGRDTEALAVLRYVATQSTAPVDLGHMLRLWAGLGACVQGDLAVADRLLHETPEDSVPPDARAVRNLLQVALGILQSPPGKRTLGALERAHLDGVASGSHDPATRRLAALTRSRVADHLDDRWMRISEWRELHPNITWILTVGGTMALIRLLVELTS